MYAIPGIQKMMAAHCFLFLSILGNNVRASFSVPSTMYLLAVSLRAYILLSLHLNVQLYLSSNDYLSSDDC